MTDPDMLRRVAVEVLEWGDSQIEFYVGAIGLDRAVTLESIAEALAKRDWKLRLVYAESYEGWGWIGRVEMDGFDTEAIVASTAIESACRAALAAVGGKK